MARNDEFEKSLKLFQKKLSQRITRSIKAETEMLAESIAKAMVFIAKVYLDEGCRPYKDANSSDLVAMVKNNIYCKKIGDSNFYKVSVRDDSEGLSTFLEFGTGHLGEQTLTSLTSYARSIGWRYDVNKAKHFGSAIYRRIDKDGGYKQIYKTSGHGFIFRRTGNNFISKDDVYPFVFDNKGNVLEQEAYSHIIRIEDHKRIRKLRNGKIIEENVKGFNQTRTRHANKNYVYSQGIRGTFYMYRAKRLIQRIIKRSRTTYDLAKNIKDAVDATKSGETIFDPKRNITVTKITAKSLLNYVSRL